MASIPFVAPGTSPALRARVAASWFVLPVALVAVGVALSAAAKFDDRDIFDGVLLSSIVIAITAYLNDHRIRRRMLDGGLEARARLAETEAHLGDLVEHLPAAVYRDRYRRADGAFVSVDYVSPQMELLTGFPTADFIADPDKWTTLVHPDDRDGDFAINIRRHLDGAGLEREYRIIHRDGRTIWVREEAHVVAGGSDTIITHGLMTDITDRKVLEQQLNRLAFHDPLTGLANRALFHDRLTHALSSRSRASRTAVLFLDLDGFKTVNDSLGHAAGDQLLAAVAARLVRAARPGDTVARFGGDEFSVLLEDVADAGDAQAVADRLLAVIRAPVDIDGRTLTSRASLGIAMAGRDGATPDELLRNADAAMYRAKAEHRGQAVVFESSIHEDALARLDLEQELRVAIEGGHLHLVFQPIVAFDDRRVTGAEALARWTHPKRGSIPPSVFVPLAEESDLILELGAWALEQACRQTATWLETGTVPADFSVAVNVSARQLTPALPSEISAVLERTGLAARNLTIEVTESIVMRDASASRAALQAIRSLGVSVAMDDFGTGYSSLAHLRSLPIDTVKIDGLFVANIHRPFEAAVVRAVVELARLLGLQTVAEGVESEAQAARLAELGCDRAQGYLLGRPAAPDRFRAAAKRGTAAA